MTPELRAAIDLVLYAWSVEGPSPQHHRAAKTRLAKDWPRLHQALTELEETFSKK